MTIDTQKLRELLEKSGTPTLYKRTSRHTELDGRRWGWLSEHPPGSHNTSLKTEWTQGERSDYRADLLVKLVNGLPAMLDHIDAQAAEIERLREAITDYLQAQDAVDNNEYQSMPEDFGKLNARRKAARDVLDAALSGEPT